MAVIKFGDALTVSQLMRILDVCMFFARESGGVKRYLHAKRDWLSGQVDVEHRLLVPGARSDAQTVAELPLPTVGGYRLPLRLRTWYRRIVAAKPDLIEAGDPWQLAWPVLAAAQRLQVPAVAYCHSDIVRLLGDRLGGVGERVAAAYLRRLYNRFNLILAPTHDMVKRLAGLGIEARVQPLGVDSQQFTPMPTRTMLRRKLALEEHQKLLVFAGRFAPEKRIDVLARAMKQLGPTFQLLLIGSGRLPDLPGNVTVWPYLQDSSALAAVFSGADALVHAGDCETFGLVVLEAMACGCPPVVARAAALAQVVPESLGEFAPPGDGRAMAAAIRRLLARDQPPLRNAVREHVQAHCQWSRVLANQLLVYRQLCGSHRGASAEQALIG